MISKKDRMLFDIGLALIFGATIALMASQYYAIYALGLAFVQKVSL